MRNKNGLINPKEKRLEDMFGKTVLLVTKAGYWFVGWLKGISNRGVIITGVVRLEPVFDNDTPVIDERLHATVRRSYPFIIPIDGSDNIHVRKMFVPWSNIQFIGRAKLESEVIKEEEEKRKQQGE